MAATLKLHACPLPLPPATKSHPSSSLAYNNSLTIHDSRLQWRLCSSASLMSVRGRSLTWRRRCIGIGIGTNNEPFPSAKLIKLIRDFYEILNKKETKRLSELIDSHCIFEDLAFASPFKGKQVHLYLEELSSAMGQNVRFRIDDVYEEGEENGGARWHLEWKDRAIPFTKGCSFFYCARSNGNKLLIKKACVFIESPLKPGAVVLELLRMVTSFFDKFPKLAVWFLEKPHAIFQFMLKAYRIFVEPLILPVLVYYTHLWTYGARILSYVLNIMQIILRLFI